MGEMYPSYLGFVMNKPICDHRHLGAQKSVSDRNERVRRNAGIGRAAAQTYNVWERRAQEVEIPYTQFQALAK